MRGGAGGLVGRARHKTARRIAVPPATARAESASNLRGLLGVSGGASTRAASRAARRAPASGNRAVGLGAKHRSMAEPKASGRWGRFEQSGGGVVADRTA